jgi:hypothetical protein
MIAWCWLHNIHTAQLYAASRYECRLTSRVAGMRHQRLNFVELDFSWV